MEPMVLHGYFRSSAAWRVRIALNLKRLPHRHAFVHLRRGAQTEPAHLARNPQGMVPVLETGKLNLSQSLAIIEWLEETHPAPPLLPPDAAGRARVRSLAQIAAVDTHPLQNLRVLRHLMQQMGQTQDQANAFAAHWNRLGLHALEARLAAESDTGRFCHGDAPGLADLCLVPQLASARRFGVGMTSFPTCLRIEGACLALPEFADAASDRQPDAE